MRQILVQFLWTIQRLDEIEPVLWQGLAGNVIGFTPIHLTDLAEGLRPWTAHVVFFGMIAGRLHTLRNPPHRLAKEAPPIMIHESPRTLSGPEQ